MRCDMSEEDKEVFIKFGQNIKKFRRERNMTIKELSELTGIRVQYLYKIEAGKAYGLKTSHIFIFADAFKMKSYEIVRGM